MIVFTVTNTVTDEVFVGTTKDSAAERWQQLVDAHTLGISSKLYKDIRDFGEKAFQVQEYAVAYDREDLKDLFEAAMEEYEGISLVGVKTSVPKVKVAKPAARKTVTRSSATGSSAPKKVASSISKPSVSAGRTGNAAKEKAIKEAIETERAQREAVDRTRQAEQAKEMREIMARLDARGSSLRRR